MRDERELGSAELEGLLAQLIEKYRVPGASLAVLDGDKTLRAAAGVTSLSTGVEVTTDTLFQIGSITKVYTTSLVMQLVDKGKVNLSDPIGEYLPGIAFGSPEARDSITVGQLFSHSSGVEGDYFEDFGRGADAVTRYAESCASLSQLHPPGELYSYCNSGFVVAGKLIEELTGLIWDEALKEGLLAPLHLDNSVTLPEEAILHRAAIGHLAMEPGGEVMPAPVWHLPRSIGPAGLITATASDVIGFARLHLNEGRSTDGNQILSSSSVSVMQEPQTRVPPNGDGASSRGLGWTLYDWNGERIIGHDGGTVGQMAFLRIVPKRRFAACLLTNSFSGGEVYKGVFEDLFGAKGVKFPPPLRPAEPWGLSIDPSRYEGTYDRMNFRVHVRAVEGILALTSEIEGPLRGIVPDVRGIPCRPLDATTFLPEGESMAFGNEGTVVFLDFDATGRPKWLHMGGRVHRRTD